MTQRKRVEDPDIEKCAFSVASPKALSDKVKTGSIIPVRQRASRKAPLWRANPCSAIGKVDSQLEEPFSLAALRDLCMAYGSLSANSDAACVSSCQQVFRASVLAFCCKLLTSVEQVGDSCRIRAVRGAVTIMEVLYW